jgi:ferredoxin
MARFARSGRLAAMTPGMSVLDAAESVGVSIDNACRSGTCGSCKVALLSGTVSQAVEDALTDADKAAGVILACQAQATSDVVIDA